MANSGEKTFHAPERRVERGRGCWNCTHFNNGELARQHYRERVGQERTALIANAMPALNRVGRDDGSAQAVATEAAKLMAAGMDSAAAIEAAIGKVYNDADRVSVAIAEARRQDARFQIFNNMMARGAIGICMVGGAKGDFVDCRYLCDKWSGREGSSLATSGKPLDKLPEELRSELDDE